MYNYNDIKIVHLEITDRCNASCPMCARNKNGGEVNQWLPLTELTLKDIKKIFPISFIKQLNKIYMCGNNGDPIIAKDTLEIFKYFRKYNKKLNLSMNTNGSARSLEWWKELAKILGKNGYVVFGIDGLANTNHIYRKGTDFYKIIKNAKAFISNGGIAHWDFIVFGHNEHQILAAETLSKEYGFKKFRIKKTGRFFSNQKMKRKGFREVLNKKGEVEYKIYPPLSPLYQNKSLEKEEYLIKKYGSMEEYLNKTSITCKVKNDKSIFITADGNLFPCCWIANQQYIWYLPKKGAPIWSLIDKNGGIEKLNLRNNSIKEIIEGKFFKDIQKTWKKKSIKCGKLAVCAKTCGQEFDQFKDQYK